MPHKDPEVARAYRAAHKAEKATYCRAYNATHKKEIAAKAKAYKTSHKEELRLKQRAYEVAHKVELTAKNRAYKAAHKAELRLKERAYKATHKAELAATWRVYALAHKAELAAKDRAYYLTHKEEYVAHAAKRRARKANAPLNDLTHAQWLEIQLAQDHRCYYCGKRFKGHLTQDHIQPLSQGGSHTLHNVIGACRSCNSRKHTSAPPIPVQPLLLTIAPAAKKRRRAQ